jgi:hypothetical protein
MNQTHGNTFWAAMVSSYAHPQLTGELHPLSNCWVEGSIINKCPQDYGYKIMTGEWVANLCWPPANLCAITLQGRAKWL